MKVMLPEILLLLEILLGTARLYATMQRVHHAAGAGRPSRLPCSSPSLPPSLSLPLPPSPSPSSSLSLPPSPPSPTPPAGSSLRRGLAGRRQRPGGRCACTPNRDRDGELAGWVMRWCHCRCFPGGGGERGSAESARPGTGQPPSEGRTRRRSERLPSPREWEKETRREGGGGGTAVLPRRKLWGGGSWQSPPPPMWQGAGQLLIARRARRWWPWRAGRNTRARTAAPTGPTAAITKTSRWCTWSLSLSDASPHCCLCGRGARRGRGARGASAPAASFRRWDVRVRSGVRPQPPPEGRTRRRSGGGRRE